MSAHSTFQRIVVIIILLGGICTSTFANPVYTYGGDFDLPIPGNPKNSRGLMFDAIIEIPDHFTIHDLDVGINLTHSQDFDLQIFLISPSRQSVCLNMYNLDRYFEGEDYTNTIFDDEAAVPIEMGEPPFTGRFKPMEPLSLFDGEDAYGLWRLRIYDAYYADTGSLNNFKIVITVIEPATAILLLVGIGFATLLRPRR
jgi:subtilisin-like proprotein convertase family protein